MRINRTSMGMKKTSPLEWKWLPAGTKNVTEVKESGSWTVSIHVALCKLDDNILSLDVLQYQTVVADTISKNFIFETYTFNTI